MTDTPEAVAWLHTLHMEGGQTYEKLLDWDGVDEDDPRLNAFGIPGRDYSPEYTVTTQPLYTRPADDLVRQLVGALKAANAAIENDTGLDDAICCSGHECGCCGSSHRQFLLYNIGQTLTAARAAGYGGDHG